MTFGAWADLRAIGRLSGDPQVFAAAVGPGAERLDRMERGIEAIAEEVERISENQRFVTQLMSNPEVRMLRQTSDNPDEAQLRRPL